MFLDDPTEKLGLKKILKNLRIRRLMYIVLLDNSKRKLGFLEGGPETIGSLNLPLY